ncbi:MAG: hypothetical protein FWD03_08430, partial [Defluviitaleaceae bacterium]|nr:hypothetical protein [Defluviitaleaceae bacterium]
MNSIRKQWDALQAAAADYRHEAAKALFNECRLGISERIAAEAIRLSRFGSADEELYNHCAWLMAAYKAAVAFCEEAGEDIVSPEVKEIIEGIVTILHSRLSEFEDAASVREESGNPIAEEKLAIVAQTLNSLEKAKPDEKVKIEIKQGAKWVKDGLMSVNQSLLEIAQSDVFPALHESYLKSLAVCQSRLNDFALRKTVQFYQAKMEDELEILSAIIKIQVKALEQDMNGDIEETPEKIAVHKILSMLREAYQRFGRAATVLSTIPEQPKQEPESYERFEAFLIDYWNQIEIEADSCLKAQINAFKTKIEKEAEILLGKCRLAFLKSQNGFRQMTNKEINLANAMTDIFVEMQDNWPKLEAEGEGAEILKGVAETLEIKIDGLRESISQ